MSASEQMRAMLDKLMGTDVNGKDDDRNRMQFTDSRVCRPFLLHCCAHEIFELTRLNIGRCRRIHDVRLRTDFEKSQASKECRYDLEVKNNLISFLADRDHRNILAQQKLDEAQEVSKKQLAEKENVVEELKCQVEAKIAEAERLGEQGLVEDSLKATEELEELVKKQKEAELECKTAIPALDYQQQKMRVCQVCTSLLGVQDNDRRLADHFGGKLHLGFIFVQEKLQELEENLNKRSKENLTSVTGSNSGEEASGSTERDNRRIRSRGRRRRSKNRKRSRERTRRSYRSRSRSRDYKRGSHSRQSDAVSRRYRD